MRRLLLTGASGFLGWNICSEPQTAWKITGAVHTRDVAILGVPSIKVDLSNEQAIRDLWDEVKPQAVIHAAAQSNPNYCEQHPEETEKINVDAAVLLADLCSTRNLPFVFTSTDLVFDGRKGNYTEDDPVNPLNRYGDQKARAEEEILKVYPEATICRLPLMFGYGGPFAGSFMQPFLQRMKAGEELALFYDEYRSAVGGRCASQGLLLALEHFHGTYHLGGRERLSRYDFGLMMKEVFDLPNAIIRGISQSDIIMPAERPADVSLDSSKAYSEGYDPLPAIQELALLREHMV
jgi:dTDP-4-dehydrorhamnose reductase